MNTDKPDTASNASKTADPAEPGNLIEERRDYTANKLSRASLAKTPEAEFTQWLQDARDQHIIDATAMTLCTADNSGQPHSRIVLLKHFDELGFVWYTYQESDKAQQMEQNPKAALQFYWSALERQVRIEGSVEKLPAADADEYFYTRPEGSRFSAAASIQSAPVRNRESLEKKVAELHGQYPNGNVPRPAAWGGYRLKPHRYEFWQGRSDRLHDRFIFEQQSAGASWDIQRISP